MVRYEECIGFEVLLFASLGEVKSNRNRLGPGESMRTALKCDSLTGQYVGGNQSSGRDTVRVPSSGCIAGSAILPYIESDFW